MDRAQLLVDTYKRAHIHERYLLTRDALGWWSSMDYDHAVLKQSDAGLHHIQGKFHQEMIADAFQKRERTDTDDVYFDYVSSNWIINHDDLGYKTGNEKDVTSVKSAIEQDLRLLFQQIFKDGVAIIYWGKQRKAAERVVLKDTREEPTTDETNASILLVLRHVALRETKEDMERESERFARIISDAVQNSGTSDEIGIQRDAYDAQIRVLQGELSEKGTIGDIAFAKLLTTKDVGVSPVGPPPTGEIERLKDALARKEEEFEELEDSLVKARARAVAAVEITRSRQKTAKVYKSEIQKLIFELMKNPNNEPIVDTFIQTMKNAKLFFKKHP